MDVKGAAGEDQEEMRNTYQKLKKGQILIIQWQNYIRKLCRKHNMETMKFDIQLRFPSKVWNLWHRFFFFFAAQSKMQKERDKLRKEILIREEQGIVDLGNSQPIQLQKIIILRHSPSEKQSREKNQVWLYNLQLIPQEDKNTRTFSNTNAL